MKFAGNIIRKALIKLSRFLFMCIFCQIIAGDVPAHKIYEDENILAFLDVKAVHPGHTLVVPKKHITDIEEASESDLAVLMAGVKKIGGLLKEKLGYAAYNIHQNNGPLAGQTVLHLHFHIIPRLEGDGLKHWPARAYAAGEAEMILAKLKS